MRSRTLLLSLPSFVAHTDIQKYADGSARSKVGNAVRRGVAAHEFDDDLDDHGVAERPMPAAS